jgi:hypothetical protein
MPNERAVDGPRTFGVNGGKSSIAPIICQRPHARRQGNRIWMKLAHFPHVGGLSGVSILVKCDLG